MKSEEEDIELLARAIMVEAREEAERLHAEAREKAEAIRSVRRPRLSLTEKRSSPAPKRMRTVCAVNHPRHPNSPEDWPDGLKKAIGREIASPAEWAQKCVRDWKADLICLKLLGIDPLGKNLSGDHAAQTVKAVLEAVDVPLIIWGCGALQKDSEVLPQVSQAARGENCLLGTITQDNYKTLTAVATAYKHKLIAESPCDVNIAKQVNILASDMGFPVKDIVIYPTSGPLGYGLEYIYSVMERARLAGLKGDAMLSQPLLCDIGIEAWGVKETRVTEQEVPAWGPQKYRAPLWEAGTAATYLASGADLLILRHPEAVKAVKQTIAALSAE